MEDNLNILKLNISTTTDQNLVHNAHKYQPEFQAEVEWSSSQLVLSTNASIISNNLQSISGVVRSILIFIHIFVLPVLQLV